MELSVEERIALRNELIENFKERKLVSKTRCNNIYKLISTDRLISTLSSDQVLNTKYQLYISQFRSDGEALYCILHFDDITNHLCPICGNFCSFYKHVYSYGITSKYGKSCENKECMYKLINSDSANQKRKATSLLHYGVEHPLQSKAVQEKIKQTNKNLYGVEYATQSDIVKEKIKQTNLQNLGVEYPMQSKEVQEKSKQTLIEKYGVEHPAQSQDIINKMKQTSKDRWGFENPMSSPIVQKKFKESMIREHGVDSSFKSSTILEKAKKTNLEQYGCENVMQCKEIHEKAKATNVLRYGVENPMQCKEIQEKAKQTNIYKYWYVSALSSPEIKEKIIKTNIDKFGVGNPMQCEEIKEKARNTNRLRYGYDNPMQNEDIKEKARRSIHRGIAGYTFDDKEIDSLHNELNSFFGNELSLLDIYSNNTYFTKFIELLYNSRNRLLLLTEIALIFGCTSEAIKSRLDSAGILKYVYIREPQLEAQFRSFLEKNNISYTRRDRHTIPNNETGFYLEIDFILDNIGVEINDISSHNISYKDKTYHLNKTLQSKEKGIRLIHIWEWELRDELLCNRLNNWILNLCNSNKTRIFARKCDIRSVDASEEKLFLNTYHLQGYQRSEVCYGLYYNNELIQLMSFCKPRYNKKYEWELLRLCTKYSYSVIGGANKLLKSFIRSYSPKSIISYCDLSKFTGNVYTDMGFKLRKFSEPQIIWYNPKSGKHFSQASLTMVGADKLLGTNFGKGTSNESIVSSYGFKAIYNCGLNVYVL